MYQLEFCIFTQFRQKSILHVMTMNLRIECNYRKCSIIIENGIIYTYNVGIFTIDPQL